jgi:hypothetical protein
MREEVLLGKNMYGGTETKLHALLTSAQVALSSDSQLLPR